MKMHSRRVTSMASRIAALTALAVTLTAAAQDGAAPEAAYYVVTSEVNVRSGPADSYYPFGRLESGDVIKVVGEKHEWARVVTTGPAFKDFFAFLRYPLTEAGRFKLEADGRRGRTQGMTRVLAPNMNTGYDPNDSWKRILLLEGDRVVEVIDTQDDGRLIVHKIALPADAEGWVNKRFLAPATDAQIVAWKAAVARGPQAAKTPGTPAPPGAAGAAGTPAAVVLAREEPVVAAVAPPKSSAAGDTLEATRLEVSITETTIDETEFEFDETVLDEPRIDEAEFDETKIDTVTIRETSIDETSITTEGVTEGTLEVIVPAIEPEKGATDIIMGGAAKSQARSLEERLEGLEEAYARLRQERIDTAEVVPMRALYLDLADASVDDDAVFRYAQARAEQLAIWADLQQQRAELSRVRQRLDLASEESRAVRLAIETRGVYVAVGRLSASTIYDGSRLPRLLRIQEVSTGRTLAYVEPDDAFDFYPMLGQLIGVVGRKYKSAELGVNVVEPKRIDLLGEKTG